jgi:glucose repression mediator protein
VGIATSIPSQDHNQIGQEQLERIAQQHQQEQAQLQAQAAAHAQAEQDAHVRAQVQAVQAQVQAHVQAQVAQAQAQQAQDQVQVQPLQDALAKDSHVIHVNALDSNNNSTLATVPITAVAR